VLLHHHRQKGQSISEQYRTLYVTLKLTDDTNMIGISPEPIKIPEDKNFNPAVRLIAAYNVTAPNILEATLKDIEGNNVSGVGVSFISISGNGNVLPFRRSH